MVQKKKKNHRTMPRLNPQLAVALIVVLVIVLTTNEDAVSAFIASSNRRAPAPALIVVREPVHTSIDWDMFEQEEMKAFDTAVIQRNTDHYYRTNGPMETPLLKTTTSAPIQIPADDMTAWKGSLLMATGLLVSHYDIPAMMLLLSTAAGGEFGTAVRLTSRCVWNAADVCQVLASEGFQSVRELLHDVGVIEEETAKENWMVSWAKRSWKKAVSQEREWADALRQSFVPDNVEEEQTPQEATFPVGTAVPLASAAAVVESANQEPPQTFAAVLQREEGVLSLPVKRMDVDNKPMDVDNKPDNKQRVRDLMRQQREQEQQSNLLEAEPTILEEPTEKKAPESPVSSRQRVRELMLQRQHETTPNLFTSEHMTTTATLNAKPIDNSPSLFASEHATTKAALHTAKIDNRQRVRDLMRQRQQGTPSLVALEHVATTASVTAESNDSRQRVRDLMRQRQETATPTVVASEPVATTKYVTAESSASDSRQRVRDLMRQGREHEAPTSPKMVVSESTPSLISQQATSSPTTVLSAKEKAAFSRKRVRDLLRQRREQDAQQERLATTAALKEHIAAQEPTQGVVSMEESFRKQRALNSSVRNKIRGLVMEKHMHEEGMFKQCDAAQNEAVSTEEPRVASGSSPLMMTEKKSLQEAQAVFAARQTMESSSTAAVEPVKRRWRKRIVRLLTGASPQGWVGASSAKQFA